MKATLLLLMSCCLLAAQAATASDHPKGKRNFSHRNESSKGKNAHMTFRKDNRAAPLLDLKAHNPEQYKTVRVKHYKAH